MTTRQRAWMLATTIAVLFAGPGRTEEAVQTRLETIEPSAALLKTPVAVEGDFDVATEPPRLHFARLPGQWDGARLWSSWGEALFASDGNYYLSIGDHAAPHGTAYVYRVDPKTNAVTRVVDYNAVVKRNEEHYSPGKIHGGIVDGGDGWLYFFGYRGSVRHTTKAADYRGDWLLRYRMADGRVENLGIAVPFSSVPVLVGSTNAKPPAMFGLAVPGQTMPEQVTQFFHYDLTTKKTAFRAPLQARGPRAMVVDTLGRAWFGVQDDQGGGSFRIYDPLKRKVTDPKLKIPGDGMLRAATAPRNNGTVICFSKDGKIFELNTGREKTRVIAQAFDTGSQYVATCRIDSTGRFVYYTPGAHGKSSRAGTPLIQLDTGSGRRKVLAFLNDAVRAQHKYNLGGTYGLAINRDGSQLMINWNGAQLPLGKQSDFGLCSVMLVDIPASERGPAKQGG